MTDDLLWQYDFFNKDGNVYNNEGWVGYHQLHDRQMRQKEREEQQRRDFDVHWYDIDRNRDKFITYDEAVDSKQDADEYFSYYSNSVNSDGSLDYESVFNTYMQHVKPYKNKIKWLWKHAF